MAADGILIGTGLLAGVTFGPLAVVVLTALLVVFQLVHGRVQMVRVGLIALCVLIGVIRGSSVQEPVAVESLTGSNAAMAVVESLPVAGGDYERTVVRLERLQQGETWLEATGRVLVYLPEGGPGVSVGDRLHVIWDPTPVDSLAPGYGRFVRSQGASGTASVFAYSVEDSGPTWLGFLSDMRRRTADALEQTIGGDAGALAAGIVTGDDTGLSEIAEHAFRQTGTSHITAVSGQNVALLLAFLSLWMRPGRRSTRAMTHVVMILTVWLYAAMVGMEPPALRAAIVASLVLLGTWSGRRPDPLTILALALGGMALWRPQMVGSVGFWLSASASWALCGTVRTAYASGGRAMVLDVARGVAAANLATLPILMWTFGEWSPISPLANMILGPIMTLTFPAAYVLALLALITPPLATWLAWVPAVGLELSIVVVERLAPLLPQIQLHLPGHGASIIIALPCFLALTVMSHDGDRWRGIVVRRWQSERPGMLAIASGLGAGVVILAVGMIIVR